MEDFHACRLSLRTWSVQQDALNRLVCHLAFEYLYSDRKILHTLLFIKLPNGITRLFSSQTWHDLVAATTMIVVLPLSHLLITRAISHWANFLKARIMCRGMGRVQPEACLRFETGSVKIKCCARLLLLGSSCVIHLTFISVWQQVCISSGFCACWLGGWMADDCGYLASVPTWCAASSSATPTTKWKDENTENRYRVTHLPVHSYSSINITRFQKTA